jgi:hypothetical protein
MAFLSDLCALCGKILVSLAKAQRKALHRKELEPEASLYDWRR